MIPNGNPRSRYPWGDRADPENANYSDTNIGTTSAVGCFTAGVSPYGCEEMSGNVWEWQRSEWVDHYPYEADKREAATLHNKLRVLRGGAFNDNVQGVRCACRGMYDPFDRSWDVGFRVAVVAVSPFPPVSGLSGL